MLVAVTLEAEISVVPLSLVLFAPVEVLNAASAFNRADGEALAVSKAAEGACSKAEGTLDDVAGIEVLLRKLV